MMKPISRIVYTSQPGPILPELRWHEQFVITREKLSLTRSGGSPGTEVNAGYWEFPLDASQAGAFFEKLEELDFSAIRRMELVDLPEGGGTESYTIVQKDGKQVSLFYDPGTFYTNGEWVTGLVHGFIEVLNLPEQAAGRYRLSAE